MSPSDLRSLEEALRQAAAAAPPPSKLTGAQRQRVGEFKAVSAVTNDRTAIRLLAQNGWDLESALNAFFTGMGAEEEEDVVAAGPFTGAGVQELERMFDRYRAVGIQEGADDATPHMEGGALRAFSADLDPNDEDGLCLYVVAHLVQAHLPLTFTREEFVRGLAAVGVASLEDARWRLPRAKANLARPDAFRDFYRFCFDWLRASPGTKVLDCETACDLWGVLFRGRFSLLDHWTAFVRDRYKRAISRDIWTQFLDFTSLRPDLSDYDADGAWPLVFDEFVEHANKTFLAH